jgi:hypothetical protein
MVEKKAAKIKPDLDLTSVEQYAKEDFRNISFAKRHDNLLRISVDSTYCGNRIQNFLSRGTRS